MCFNMHLTVFAQDIVNNSNFDQLKSNAQFVYYYNIM